MENCIFCKIISNKIPAEILYQDDRMVIIRDIDPKAKLHYLAIPRRHYALLADMKEQDINDFGHIVSAIASAAPTLGLENGYRLVINQGADAGQTVFHLHIHILGGQELPFEKL